MTPSFRLVVRRSILAAAVLVCSAPLLTAHADETLRIGYQKYGTLTVLKGRGGLEERLARLGVQVSWNEFPAGPQLLEGLNVGSIDFGTVGEAPPVFAQAAGADLVYVANQPPAPKGEAILVQKNSPIRTLADLRGKKVALNKGSNVHYLLVKALEHAGIPYADITPVYLAPADARAAFEKGAVDAWAIWDPFYAAAQRQLDARVLTDGTGLVANLQFYLASRGYAQRRPDVIAAIVDELGKLDAWARDHPKDVAAALGPQVGLPPDVANLAAGRLAYGIAPITPDVAREQQKIADTFYQLKLIPRAIRVSDALPAAPVAAK
jgi:sulfonate transport system substrate-binding protein